MSGVKRKRNVLNVKQKLEILQNLDNGESTRTDAEDILNEGNTISHSAALQSVDYMGQRGFDYGDITAVRKIRVDIRQEMNKQLKQRLITDFFKAANVKRKIPSLMLNSMQILWQRKLTQLDHLEIEMDYLQNQNCQVRQASHFPESARRLSTITEEHNGEVDGRQVTRNVSPVQDEGGENRDVVNAASERNGEVDGHQLTRNSPAIQDEGENKTDVDTASGRNGEVDGRQVTRNVPIIQDKEGENRNDVNTASERKGDVDGHQVTRNVPPIEVAADKSYFLEKCELQFKCPFERNARQHTAKPDPTQAFVHSNKRMSNLGAKQHHTTSEETIGVDDEYWRRDPQFRDEVTHEESSLEQGMTEAQHQWCRSRNMRAEYLRSQAIKNIDSWLIICALIMTFLTAVLIVILWEYLSIKSFQRVQSSNSSSLHFVPSTESSSPGHGNLLYR
ncbi:hypothetical protein AVEN_109196-1 [Araneus ventricosus]|uniref:Uncharacterized protein n=1 Tax=Araneus ventricosus TaxID=182803 RepID=A0A4Y2MNH8_ARAVE|nr:hypothetical protein AVEN_109196-1 [Araneus ventricosus]